MLKPRGRSGIKSPWKARRTRPPAAGHRFVDRQLVVAATDVLDQAMPGDHDLALLAAVSSSGGHDPPQPRCWRTDQFHARPLAAAPPAIPNRVPAGPSGLG